MGAFYLISGNDDFAVKERAGEFIHQLCGDFPEDNPDLEVIRGDSDGERFSVTLDRLLGTLDTPAFFSPKKTVWLKHFSQFDDAISEPSTKKKPSRLDLLTEFLKNGMPPDITLLIDGCGLDRRKAFFKLCEKTAAASGGTIEWFEKADPKVKGYAALMLRRVKEMAMSAGKRMDDAAASYVAEIVGSDTAQLKNEVEKLIAFVGNEPIIRMDDCYEICSRSSETLAWAFSGALAERDPAKALELIPGIIDTLEQERGSASRPEMAIVASANSEFKRLIMIKCEGRRLKIPQRTSADFFYRLADEQRGADTPSPIVSMHPFKAFKTWENACRFSDEEFADIFTAIFEANLGMVTGADPRLALEALVAKVANVR